MEMTLAVIATTKTLEMKPLRIRQAAWDLAAAFLIAFAPFSNFLSFRGYSYFQPEIILAAFVMLGIAVILTSIIFLRPDTLRPFIFLWLVIAFIYTQNEFALPLEMERWLEGHVGPDILRVLKALIYIVPIAMLFWILLEKLNVVLAATFGAMVLANLSWPHAAVEAVTIVENDTAPVMGGREALPPIVHLIVDQQIGIDGMPEEVESTSSVKEALKSFYNERGFRTYTGAFTHFPATMESVPDLLNGALEPSAREFVRVLDGNVGLEKNAWFEALTQRGYSIDVIQTDYLDYCNGEGFAVSHCYTHIASDIRELENLDIGSWEKAKLLLLTFYDEDNTLLSRASRVAWHSLQRVGAAIGLNLPDWDRRSLTLSPLPSLRAMDHLGSRLESLKPGKAIFAHVLLPHDPYILDEECALKPDVRLWLPHESALWWYRVKSDPDRRLARYAEYYKQVLCLHKVVGELLDIIERRGLTDEAIVFIHGDHGSRISMLEAITGSEDLLTPRDIIDAVSTLYAVRGPNLDSGEIEGQRSIQALFAEHALERDNDRTSITTFLPEIDPKPDRSGPEENTHGAL